MAFTTINPAEGTLLRRYPFISRDALDDALATARAAQHAWRRVPAEERAARAAALAGHLRGRIRRLAEVMAIEMGKPLGEAAAEIEKCATGCEFQGEHGPGFLADQVVETESHRSYVTFQPLGLVLAIMPWNFPFWQVVRASIPALIAGNGVLLKHAPNVPMCALELAALFRDAGFPTASSPTSSSTWRRPAR